jgi:hypothetical protein
MADEVEPFLSTLITPASDCIVFPSTGGRAFAIFGVKFDDCSEEFDCSVWETEYNVGVGLVDVLCATGVTFACSAKATPSEVELCTLVLPS